MPNNITNRLIIKAEGEKLESVLNAIKGNEEGQVMDFDKIVPQPKNLYMKGVTLEEREKLRRQGIPFWYDWRNEFWNTKWNAWDSEIWDDENEVRFITAWSGCFPVIEKLSTMFPDIEFDYTWADEDVSYNLGRYVYLNGEIIESYRPEEGSTDAYELYFDLHEEDRDCYVLVDGKYEFSEDW